MKSKCIKELRITLTLYIVFHILYNIIPPDIITP